MNAQTGFLIFLIFYMFAWLPSTVAKYCSFGMRYLGSNRSKEPGELSKWGARSIRAHNNLKDYAPIFIATVLYSIYKGLDESILCVGIWTFLICRVLHMAMYIYGQVTLRAIAWAISIGANLYLIIKLF